MNKRENNNDTVSEILPKAGLVYSEKSMLSELLCKPKIMPLKSREQERFEQKGQKKELEGNPPTTS